MSIGQQSSLTCYAVGSTGFEQLIFSASNARTVDQLTFEQLTLLRQIKFLLELQLLDKNLSSRTRTAGISKENDKHVQQLG